jgi:hypothetical protein
MLSICEQVQSKHTDVHRQEMSRRADILLERERLRILEEERVAKRREAKR